MQLDMPHCMAGAAGQPASSIQCLHCDSPAPLAAAAAEPRSIIYSHQPSTSNACACLLAIPPWQGAPLGGNELPASRAALAPARRGDWGLVQRSCRCSSLVCRITHGCWGLFCCSLYAGGSRRLCKLQRCCAGLHGQGSHLLLDIHLALQLPGARAVQPHKPAPAGRVSASLLWRIQAGQGNTGCDHRCQAGWEPTELNCARQRMRCAMWTLVMLGQTCPGRRQPAGQSPRPAAAPSQRPQCP